MSIKECITCGRSFDDPLECGNMYRLSEGDRLERESREERVRILSQVKFGGTTWLELIGEYCLGCAVQVIEKNEEETSAKMLIAGKLYPLGVRCSSCADKYDRLNRERNDLEKREGRWHVDC